MIRANFIRSLSVLKSAAVLFASLMLHPGSAPAWANEPAITSDWQQHLDACRKKMAVDVDFSGACEEAQLAVAAARKLPAAANTDRQLSLALMFVGITKMAVTDQKSELQHGWKQAMGGYWQAVQRIWQRGGAANAEIEQADALLRQDYDFAGRCLNEAQWLLARASGMDRDRDGGVLDGQGSDSRLAKLIAANRIAVWYRAQRPAQRLAAQQFLQSLQPDADAQTISEALVIGGQLVILNIPDAGKFVLERWSCGLTIEKRRQLIAWLKFFDGYADRFKFSEFTDLGAILDKLDNQGVLPPIDPAFVAPAQEGAKK
jgi:hypothetical protein